MDRPQQGRGREEKSRQKESFADSIHQENEAEARRYAEELLQLLRACTARDLELTRRLEEFLSDPTTIGEDYWLR